MKANPTHKQQRRRTFLFAMLLFCPSLFSLAASPLAPAQEIDFQKTIDSSSEALIHLDVLANDCLTTLDSMENSQTACNKFIQAIDGELMANYLEQCRLLKSWRDQYVDQTVKADLGSDKNTNEEMLRRLIAIEYSCGENTLRDRTRFVFTAFNRLNASSVTIDTSEINRQLSQRRFETLEQNERQGLQNSLQDQQDKSLRESTQQFNNLQNELIRQQIQRSKQSN